jgi:hypothetical protein
MTGIVEVSSNVPNDNTLAEWPGIVSRFQLVILASPQKQATLIRCTAADRSRPTETKEYEHRARGIEERLILFKPVAVEEAQSMA